MYRRGGVVFMYEGERLLGELDCVRQDGVVPELNEIRISHFSPSSERCPPLAVIHTINNAAAGMCLKLESTVKNLPLDSPLSLLHATCLNDSKAAIASTGQGEIYLVAMHSRKYDEQYPCFWGFTNVASSVYNSCLVMLNIRCLGIVFDLDETLIVANTMRSFEDRIEALQRKISLESDPHRLSGMQAEVKRYQEDKHILKQYADSDQVIDNGKLIKSQSEVVLALSDNHQTIVRPLIRLQDKNIILTRINPQIRDTSVLVRLRPAWEDLRNYLTARGRKRFEVFVCTMAERDYALEMWRLLDPESNLINSRELLDRIVCVKSGNRKSLFNVFQDGSCHPKMSLVIDDRLKVWDEKDQPRVHVVPAFAPYYAPQAEANNAIPVLCVARNVACNVRGGFFKDFDDCLLQRISGVAFEDDIKDVPFPPDVSNYLTSEDDPSGSNGNKDSLGFDGMADAEVERRLKEAILASSTGTPPATNLEPRAAPGVQYTIPPSSLVGPSQPIQVPALPFPSQQLPVVTLKPPVPHLGQADKILHSSPAREEGEVPESELDPDTRRRLLILQHGQDMRELPPSEPHFARPPVQGPAPRGQPHGWFPVEGDISPGPHNRVAPVNEFLPDAESHPIDKHRAHQPPFLHKVDAPVPPGRVPFENQRLANEALPREDLIRFNQPMTDIHSYPGENGPLSQPANKDPDLEAGQIDPYSEAPAGVLHDIALKCGTKVEFNQALVPSKDLLFEVEVLFAGEKIGEGSGRTRKEARLKAAEGSLIYLAEKFLSQSKAESNYMLGDGSRFGNVKGNGFIGDMNSFGYEMFPRGDSMPFSTSAPQRVLDPRVDTPRKLMGSITALEELCVREGLNMVFRQSANSGMKNEFHAQVEINGQIEGEGVGLIWDEAKSQAAENALGALKSMHGPYPYRRQDSPRSMQGVSNKRLKADFSRNMQQRGPSSNNRYPKSGTSFVP